MRLRRLVLLLVVALVPVTVLGAFVGALAAANAGTARVPAAVVNQDEFVTTENEDGTTTTVAAGRLVVTELTKPADAQAGAQIDWRLSNAEQAADLLRRGEVYAVVTIPKGFSTAIASVSGTDPEQAQVRIETDDAHGYIVSQLSASLGTSLTATLGSTVSTSVIKGLYAGYGTLKTSLTDAAEGATTLGEGADELSSGLTELADGQDGVESGARSLSGGATELGNGADTLADGLSTAADGARRSASGAADLATGVDRYTRGVDDLAENLSGAAATSAGLLSLPEGVEAYTGSATATNAALWQVLQDPTLSPTAAAAIQRIRAGLTELTESAPPAGVVAGAEGAAELQTGVASAAKGLSTLSDGSGGLRSGASALADGLGELAPGLERSASGAATLATGADDLADGADSLATGAGRIASGIRTSGDGATELGDGATTLGDGLAEGAAEIPAVTTAQAEQIAEVVAQPVTTDIQRNNETSSISQVVSALILPAALWIGASAAVLLFGAVRRRLLATGVGTGRLVGAAFTRGALLALVQAVLLVGLLVAALALGWAAVPLALLVAVVAGVAFFSVHQLLGAVFGRAGTVVSIVLLGVQLVAVGGLYPIELVSAPFQAVSPYLPLTAAVQAMQSVITGSVTGAIAGPLAVLAIYGLVAFGLTTIVVARRRSSVALFAPPAVPALG